MDDSEAYKALVKWLESPDCNAEQIYKEMMDKLWGKCEVDIISEETLKI